LTERIAAAVAETIRPLEMQVVTHGGETASALAINEVALWRQSYQTAKIRITVDEQVRLEELHCDGVMIATPAGSTAYNLSAHGPILPLDAPLLALTPVSPFRPRRWRGALLPDKASVTIEALEAERDTGGVENYLRAMDQAERDGSEKRRLERGAGFGSVGIVHVNNEHAEVDREECSRERHQPDAGPDAHCRQEKKHRHRVRGRFLRVPDEKRADGHEGRREERAVHALRAPLAKHAPGRAASRPFDVVRAGVEELLDPPGRAEALQEGNLAAGQPEHRATLFGRAPAIKPLHAWRRPGTVEAWTL
jgi:hypothetical protein